MGEKLIGLKKLGRVIYERKKGEDGEGKVEKK